MRLMTTSKDGLAIIKKNEELHLQAYRCPAGVPTIGWGHTRGVTMGMTITEEIAEQLLVEDIKPIEKQLNALGLNLRQGQFDALASFVFNAGIGAFNRSTLKKMILASAKDADIAEEFKKWNKAKVNGKYVVLGGLVKRRDEEAATWML